MATDSKDVELRVRARDYSTKTLDEVTKALDNLTKAQDAQLGAAKRGESSARELEASYKKIESAVEKLIKQSALVKLYEEQAKALDEAKRAADEARTKQLEYAKSLEGIEKKTEAQAKAVRSLASAVTQADKAQTQAQNRLDRTGASLKENGIAADQLASAQQRMANGVAVGNAALERQEQALSTIEADIRAFAATEERVAAQKLKWAQEDAAAQKVITDAAKAATDAQEKNARNVLNVAKANLDARNAQDALNASMRKSADQADAAAKGYVTLARSVASVKGGDLAAQLAAIIDPAKAANGSLDGLTSGLDRLVSQVNAINGPVKDLRTTMAALNASMKGAEGIAAQIDAFKRQQAVLKESSAAYAQAQVALRTLTTAMRAGGGDAAELGRQLATAQATLKSAAAGLAQQSTITRDLQASLKAAGVDTNNLAAAETRLIDQTNRAVGAIGTLESAYKKYGAAAEGAGKSTFKFFEGGRTTLSMTQRLKGELLALAAAYVGLQGAIDLGKSALDSFNTINKIQSQLTIASGGDAQKAAAEFTYLSAAADRIGISLREAAPAYAKFAIAAKATGLTVDQTRFIFEQLAIAGRSAGLSASDFEGVLKAVEQGFSKGSIQAEELRGQLGDRLPGAFVLFAKSIGKTTEELGKLMEKNEVASVAFIDFARTLATDYQGASMQVQALAIAQARFANETLRFQDLIARSGFADAWTELLNKITAFLASEQGTKLAKDLATAFQAVVDVIGFLIDHLEEIKIGFALLIGLTVGRWLFVAYRGIVLLIETLGPLIALTTQLTGLLTAMGFSLVAVGDSATRGADGIDTFIGRLKRAAMMIPFMYSLLKGIELVTKAFDHLEKSRAESARTFGAVAGAASGTVNRKKLDNVGMPTEGLTPDPGGGFSNEEAVFKRTQEKLKKDQEKADKELKSARKRAAKDELGDRADIIKEGFNLTREGINKDIKDATKKSELLKQVDAQEKQALLADQIRYNTEHEKSGASAAKKEVTVKEEVKNALLKIQDDLAKAEVKLDQNATFDERKKTRLDAIAHSYDKLKKSIATLSTLDKDAAVAASAKLDIYIKQLQSVEEQKVTLEEVKRLEKELEDQTKLRQAGLEQEKIKYDAGLTSQEDFLKNTAEINRVADGAITKAADNLQRFADGVVDAKKGLLSLTDQAEIKTKTTTATAAAVASPRKADEALNKAQEDEINSLVAKRTAAEAIFKAQLELRVISEDDYAKRVNDNADEYKAKILELTQVMQARLEVQRAEGILNNTLNVEQIAALDAQIARVQLLRTQTANALPELDLMGKTLSNFMTSGIDQSFNALAQSLTDIATNAKSAGDAFRQLGGTVVSFVASFLFEISKAIAKQLILNAIASSGGVLGQAAVAAGGRVSTQHSGGVVGRSTGTYRKVDMSLFANAPRFHEGGLPGLKSNEVPTILQKGEEVLDRNNPDNVLNGGRKMNVDIPDNRFVLVDDRAGVPEAMMSAEGERAQLVMLKRNRASVKQMMK
jgi:tape measure domain-containing protein